MINLGDFRLEVYEVTSISATHEDDYAEHAVIEGAPVRQYIGQKLAKMSIGATFEATFSVPADRLAALNTLRNKVLAVSSAAGVQYGRFTIDSIAETVRVTTPAGSIRQATVQLELTAEGAEPSLDDKKRAKQQGAPARKVSSDNAGTFR